MIQKIKAGDLKRTRDFTDEDMRELDDSPLIGQQRAEEALLFGLSIKADGYNIYVSGPPQTGKMTYAKKFAEKIAADEPVPPDLCYVYNFKNPERPSLLTFPAGAGKEFAEDMDELISGVKTELSEIIGSKDFEDEKNAVISEFHDKRDVIVKKVQEEARGKGFGVKMTGSGVYFMPIIDGTLITEEQFDALKEDEKEEITKSSEDIQKKAFEVMRDIKEFEKETCKTVDELEYKTTLFCVGRHIDRMIGKYSGHEKVLTYLADVKEDLIEGMVGFDESENENDESAQSFMPWMAKKSQDDYFQKYKVNLLTDNGSITGAPVIVDLKPTYASVLGEVEYDSEYGNLTADFMKIKPGLLHKANGGYLILQARDAIMGAHIWETLRQVIKTKEIVIEPLREYFAGIAVSGVKPEPAPVDVKIILVGPPFYYELLYEFDDDFSKYFKIHAVFDYEIPATRENERLFAAYIAKRAKSNGLGRFDAGAAAALAEYSSRLAERSYKLSAQFGKISEIMEEAAAWRKTEDREQKTEKTSEIVITREDVEKAISERERRANLYEEKLSEMIDRDIIMLDVTGAKTAQINGLAVIDAGDYVFAKPSRITATTYIGKAGIINIEKEAEMSGSIHDKGVEVLTGYLGQKYAQDFPLSLSCRICFEQNYSGIDGDSASSAELYAILSSLADAPLKQSFAVTGSINQRGEIQPIGGVTYKIEGFFDLCKKRGLTGDQGVIIPASNVSDLTLRGDVISAVEADLFHIYAITRVDDGIRLLTDIEAGERNDKGKYKPDTIHGRVYKKLKDFYKKSAMEE